MTSLGSPTWSTNSKTSMVTTRKSSGPTSRTVSFTFFSFMPCFLTAHFIVWMRTAGLPNFRKLWGEIKQDLKKGTYRLEIANNYDVSSFAGSKYFVLSTTNVLGGTNYFLAVCYIIVGALCIMFGIIFFIAYMGRKQAGQNNGNPAQPIRN